MWEGKRASHLLKSYPRLTLSGREYFSSDTDQAQNGNMSIADIRHYAFGVVLDHSTQVGENI